MLVSIYVIHILNNSQKTCFKANINDSQFYNSSELVFTLFVKLVHMFFDQDIFVFTVINRAERGSSVNFLNPRAQIINFEFNKVQALIRGQFLEGYTITPLSKKRKIILHIKFLHIK